MIATLRDCSRQYNLHARLAANARRLVEQRYDWAAIGRRCVALVAETVAYRQTLPPARG